MGKTEITKKVTASKGATEGWRRPTRASRQEDERVAAKKERQCELDRVTQATAIKEMRKKNAWGNLQAAEKVHRVLKEAYEKEETAWARACIKKG